MMSTICFDTEKFLKIRQSFYHREQDLACAFKYPEGWQNGGMKAHIDKFVQDLRIANIRAYNERYEENEPEEILPARTVMPYPSEYHLLKSLHAIDYNLDDQNVNGCAERLHDIIYNLMYEIISNSPAYDKAKAWD